MKLKILLTPIGEKLASFRAMICSVLEFGAINWLEMENIPRLNQNFGERELQSWGMDGNLFKILGFF